jgi:UDP-N-acetylglucosamine 2-epimerase (non-hydrolysing)
VENLRNRARVTGFVDTVLRIAGGCRVRFVVHEPTRRALVRFALMERLRAAPNLETTPLVPHQEFVALLHGARFAITDGGSIQEECAMIGLPTLLWRDRTERHGEYGLGENVVLSHYDSSIVDEFLADPERRRRPPRIPSANPSEQILDELIARLNQIGAPAPSRAHTRRGRR